MPQAIFGLIGVIVGGIITAGFQQLAQHRQHKREQRLAARILLDELGWWRSILEYAIDQDDVSALGLPGAVLAAWEEQRIALVDLKPDEWTLLHLAVRSASGDVGDAPQLPTGTPMGGTLASGLKEQIGRIDEASDVLARYA